EDAHLEVLRRGYRVPAAVVEFASALLPTIAPGIAPPEPVRSNRGELEIVDAGDALPKAVVAGVAAATDRLGSVGVIAADDHVADVAAWLTAAGIDFGDLADDARVTVVPATLAKGLEYDHVVAFAPERLASLSLRRPRRLIHASNTHAALPLPCC